ncbi:GntR family transcriptional regulator [Rhizobium rhizosphaerae]|uniref:GntR family transcriptional regulator n=1 Tax=Xaviernesmea rhizosphaerae TaxID=1672749 RepID=A0A1Q9AHN7_9HYPH|nr:GntR family transcriptional regulator [Xaviernesmea rhizosphaerae]
MSLVREPVTSPATFTSSARAVFKRLIAVGQATRPQLCEDLNLSRPTLSAAMAELSRFDYVEVIGQAQGHTGRTAAIYQIGKGAGHTIAVDAGSTVIRYRVAYLDGRLLLAGTYALSSGQRHMSAEISRMVDQAISKALSAAAPDWGPLRAVGVAVPARVTGQSRLMQPGREILTFDGFSLPAGVPLVLENNVNCAAIAEYNYGAAIGRPDFAFVQVGLKIGMGMVLRGELIRGRNGAAGEVSHLPFPWSASETPQPETLEDYLGVEAFMARVRADWPDDDIPRDSVDLFDRASKGDAAATAHIRRHGHDIGRLVSAGIAVIDPGFAVLGGGVGSLPLLLPYVREEVARLSYSTDIETSTLGADATLLGIGKLAAARAQTDLIDTVNG